MALPQMPTHTPAVDANGKMNRLWVRWLDALTSFVGADDSDASGSSVVSSVNTLSTQVLQLQRDTAGLSQGRQL
jgi:hypothetical protein